MTKQRLTRTDEVSGKRNVPLRDIAVTYRHAEMDRRIVNIDASRRCRKGRWWNPAGAHSDIWYPESAHLLRSLADLAR
ncbi:hypothetical protein ACFQ1S_16095 [Kibdelosporangium lantanae]|uniref:Uncharacterized protein n=1 Tax=Kibdelosporangium lantanae TaxID=1497396 RepID=A0ABW3M8N0_9PSEU